ncbi:hypothetical protein GCM10023116_19320 [Kistimonas scapharcae]|uniref:Uncharacterized protein n=1 Tax=Kistimonas scapharcae TaxID=1036133 RepID=A0ABP8V261_9GAMM
MLITRIIRINNREVNCARFKGLDTLHFFINTKADIINKLPSITFKLIPDYHCGSASLRSLAGMGQVRAAM